MISPLNLSFIVLAFSLTCLSAEPTRTRLDDGWRFIVDDPANAQSAKFNDAAWLQVTLPHDWSIKGMFGAKNPAGALGAFLPGGVGWYRKRFDMPADWAGKRVKVEFEGVYMNADVYLNGQHLASHPYGYTSFFVDLTPALKSGTENVLAVRVDNSQQQNSRWYSGSGIYRHVWLTVTDLVHVAPWGVFVHIPKADRHSATVDLQTQVVNDSTAQKSVIVKTILLAPDGSEVGKAESPCNLAANATFQINQQIVLSNPALWSPEKPQISKALTRVMEGAKALDEVTTNFGVRHLAWSSKSGLTINGTPIKITGGCIHGDNGVLGTAAFDQAEERKIECLKASGFNEIRTAHNPPSPALLDACDRLGMLVMDEAFDCWSKGKKKYDYAVVFKDWWQRDLDAMVLRDRNHPSIVFWSIGNEIPDQYKDDVGGVYCQQMVDRIHALDRSRPVTMGILNMPKTLEEEAVAEKMRSALDVVGCNYNLSRLIAIEGKHPERVLVATETKSGNPSDIWNDTVKNDFVIGDNVWSAQDYLGEAGIGRWFMEGDPTEPLVQSKNPTDSTLHPVGHGKDSLYPWHGAVCGDLDILGRGKPLAHLRNIVWNRGEKLYLAVRQPQDDKKVVVAGWGWYPTSESWTWPGREGKPAEVEVYSRYDKVRLYLNNKLVGEESLSAKDGCRKIYQLAYEPGTLKAVGLMNGKEVEAAELVTAGAPAAIRLKADRKDIKADGQDLSFVDVEVIDKAGNVQPNSANPIFFTLSGPGTIAGLGNANLKSEDPYVGSKCKVYQGRALVVVRTTGQSGKIDLKAQSAGLAGAQLQIEAAP